MAMVELGLEPHQIVIVSGIGQAGKFPHYLRANTFNGLHGRTLPVATGIKLANHEMIVVAVAGDGDAYGEGGNHLLHAIRRNINIKLFVHNNQVYALTKGQASPTSAEGMVTKMQPFGSPTEPLNPLALAIAMNCSFVARSFAGDIEHLKEMMKEAIKHRGFALLDILQPCVSFNQINTYDWYKKRIYNLEPDYDPKNRSGAWPRALEWGEKIPVGIIYKIERPLYEEKIPVLQKEVLVRQSINFSRLTALINEFY